MATAVSRAKFIAFSLIPVVGLTLSAELVCRVKFFVFHHYDWNYMVAPFKIGDSEAMDHGLWMPPDPSASQDARDDSPAGQNSDGQMVFAWHKPCLNHEAFSERLQRPAAYTFDDYCFRGDRVALQKPSDEYRLFVLGGSTVQDFAPDGDTMVDSLKSSLPASAAGRRVMVVNAGHLTYGSNQILTLYRSKVVRFAPDVVVYHEAWNEQAPYTQVAQVENRIAAIQGALHRTLHYRSMLYTYLVEKFHFSTTEAVRFWKIDLESLSRDFTALAEAVRASGARFILITQPVNFPRHFRGADTFDFDQVDRLLDSLQRDPSYTYDTYEISALNQRLALGREVQIARQLGIPVIDILPEIEELGDDGRKEMFIDLGHRSWAGNRLVGSLVGAKLQSIVWPTATH